MKNLMKFIFLLILSGCSYRYTAVAKASRKLEEQDYTSAQYDSVMNTFYTIQDSNFVLCKKLKTTGSYVIKGYNHLSKKNDFRTMKFTDNSQCYSSIRFYEWPSNYIIERTEGVVKRHTFKNNKVIIEYLQYRNLSLYNIYKYGNISANGDTLTFYKSVNIQMPRNASKIEEVYIYNPSLTSLPLLPK
jgi:hypothetical protein